MSTFPSHVYIHTPFCRDKCGYCSFFSQPYREEAATQWRAALRVQREQAQARLGRPCTIDSLYWGGGSPTALPPAILAATMADMRAGWPLHAGTEITVEVNPATLTPGHAAVLRDAGVTRASIGVQSFDLKALLCLGRKCLPEQAEQAVARLHAVGIAAIGIDLILCIPDRQTPWMEDLEQAVALAPQHLSAYPLTIEPGTPLAQRLSDERIPVCSDAATSAVLDQTETFLAGYGLHQYEISNYARTGFECRHNLNTWMGGDYLGFGPTACSRIGRERWQAAADGSLMIDTLDLKDDWTERVMFMPRTRDGLAPAALASVHPDLPDALLRHWETGCHDLAAQGLMTACGRRWILTRRGRRCADAVAEALLPPD